MARGTEVGTETTDNGQEEMKGNGPQGTIDNGGMEIVGSGGRTKAGSGHRGMNTVEKILEMVGVGLEKTKPGSGQGRTKTDSGRHGMEVVGVTENGQRMIRSGQLNEMSQ
jgi:hypothetical protein